VETKALQEDVEAGRARSVGERIEKPHVVEPVSIFYEKVARVHPEDPRSPKIGIGRFEAEIWVLSGLGVNFAGFTKAQLVATRFFFDALFPFVLLFLLSFVTKPVPRSELDKYFGKIHTPVQPTPEEDERAVEAAMTYPETLRNRKIWPRSSWEIMKPGKADIIGFGGTWLLVGVIILLLWLMVTIK
jgi:SSS family solute:Na+ symporter